MKFLGIFGRGKAKLRKAAGDPPKRIRVADDPMFADDAERQEYEEVLNAALRGGPEGVLFERQADGVLRQVDRRAKKRGYRRRTYAYGEPMLDTDAGYDDPYGNED